MTKAPEAYRPVVEFGIAEMQPHEKGQWVHIDHALALVAAERNRYKARAERASSQLEAVRNEMEHVVECLCEEAEQARDESLKERSYKLAESCEATLAQIDAEGKTVFDMVSREEWQEMDERESNPNVAEPAEPRQPTVKPLEWEGDGYWTTGEDGGWMEEANTAFGWGYLIKLGYDANFMFDNKFGCSQGGFDTPDEAKAAAQADYERRILSAIEYRQPTVQEAARVLLSDKTAAHELATNLMRRHEKTKGTKKGGYYPALCYALRALAEGDRQ